MGKPTGFLEFQRVVAPSRDPLVRIGDWKLLATLDKPSSCSLLTTQRGLKGEIKVGERLDGWKPGGAHRGLQPALIAQPNMAAQQLADRLPSGELAAVGAAQTVIEGFERPGHLEIGQLMPEPIAQGEGRH